MLMKGRPRSTRNPCLFVATLALAILGAPASSSADSETIGFSEIAAIHSEVVVPVPSEIFNVLDKFDVRRNQWHKELQVPKDRDCSGRTHTALFLGSVVAEGFLAVQAEDGPAVTELGEAVLELADELGLRDVVLKHSKSIIDAANKGEWQKVREEFDATRQTVRETMERRRDQDLAHCVSVGGWVRGTEIITSIIRETYSPQKAEILHQPDLLQHFARLFRDMEEARRDNRLKALVAGLDRLQPLMSRQGPISAADIAAIHRICHQLARNVILP